MGNYLEPIPEFLEHSIKCRNGSYEDSDPECPAYFVLAHSDGHHHCKDCHGLLPDGPNCGHWAGCPGC